MHRVRYADLSAVKAGDELSLDRSENSHLFKILRARSGENAVLLDGSGRTASATVSDSRTLIVQSVETHSFDHRRIHLYLAPPRRQKMDQILREAAELGVYRIVPVICDFSVALPDADSAERQTDLLFEACKQSGNPFLPVLSAPLRFQAALADAVKTCGVNVFGSPYESTENGEKLPDDVGFFVGPEGGFSAQEEDAMRKAGFRSMRIGPWILRVETAAVAGIARLSV